MNAIGLQKIYIYAPIKLVLFISPSEGGIAVAT